MSEKWHFPPWYPNSEYFVSWQYEITVQKALSDVDVTFYTLLVEMGMKHLRHSSPSRSFLVHGLFFSSTTSGSFSFPFLSASG
jgi:hypothetical protein